MNWSDKLQEFQAELYAKIIDYLNENGDNDYKQRWIRDCRGRP